MQLSLEQQLIIDNTTDSILLLAGAGTGKTGTLAHRVAHLISSGAVVPEEILCLTFTNRACRELRERIKSLLGADTESPIIRTLHGFCAGLLRATPSAMHDLPSDFGICDQEDCLELIREVVCETLGRPIAEDAAGILQKFIGLVKDTRLAQPALDNRQAAAWLFASKQSELERLCTDRQRGLDEKFLAFLHKYGGSIAHLYDHKLLTCGMLDFSDLLLRAGALLHDPAFAPLFVGQYRYVHVDEVQDVSIAEYALVKLLCSRAVVLLCGDFNQTIYQWRGSDPDRLFEQFRADFSPLVISFSHNYRASRQLLDVAQNFRAHAFDKESATDFDPHSDDCTDLAFGVFATPAEEAAWICRQLAELQPEERSRAAVIVRTNRVCADLCDALASAAKGASLPLRFMLSDEARLFAQPQVRDLCACLRLLLSPRDSASFSRVLARLIPGVGSAKRDAILCGLREDTCAALPDLIDLRTARTGDYFSPLITALDAGNVVVFDVESTGVDVFSDEIIQLAAIRLAPDGSVSARFERFVQNTKPVGTSERVHGFSDTFLRENGIPPADALTQLMDFTDNCVIVGHNVGFDLAITTQNLLAHNIPRKFTPVIYDTLDLSRRLLKGLPNHKLATVAAALETTHAPSHDAMDDILATADVLLALTTQYILPRTEARRIFYRKHLPVCHTVATTLAALQAQSFADLPALCTAVSIAFGLAAPSDPTDHSALRLFAELAADTCDPALPVERQLAALLELASLSPAELSLLGRASDKIPVITAHQSKGCEYDYVFLPVLQDGIFPTFQSRGKRGGEESRVFYVSLTRAKKKLFLSHARHSFSQRSARPSPFLELLGPSLPPKQK